MQLDVAESTRLGHGPKQDQSRASELTGTSSIRWAGRPAGPTRTSTCKDPAEVGAHAGDQEIVLPRHGTGDASARRNGMLAGPEARAGGHLEKESVTATETAPSCARRRRLPPENEPAQPVSASVAGKQVLFHLLGFRRRELAEPIVLEHLGRGMG